jgi:hypothetical protein
MPLLNPSSCDVVRQPKVVLKVVEKNRAAYSYGQSWVNCPYRAFVCEEVQRYPLFQLTTDPTTRAKLQDAIAKKAQARLIEKQGIPVWLNRIAVGSILPPKGVVEQETQTIFQEQRKITMVEFRKAEESGEKAKRQRGIADRAYRESVGLTAPEFVDLRRIEVQNEIAQHSPTTLTVIYGPRTHRHQHAASGCRTPTDLR